MPDDNDKKIPPPPESSPIPVSFDNGEDEDGDDPVRANAPHNAATLPKRTNTGVMLAAMDRVEKGERKIWLGTMVNVGLVLTTLGLSGAFAGWVLSSSKSYAQSVDSRVDKLEKRVDDDRAAAGAQAQRTEGKVDKALEQLYDVKILLVRIADAGRPGK